MKKLILVIAALIVSSQTGLAADTTLTSDHVRQIKLLYPMGAEFVGADSSVADDGEIHPCKVEVLFLPDNSAFSVTITESSDYSSSEPMSFIAKTGDVLLNSVSDIWYHTDDRSEVELMLKTSEHPFARAKFSSYTPVVVGGYSKRFEVSVHQGDEVILKSCNL